MVNCTITCPVELYLQAQKMTDHLLSPAHTKKVSRQAITHGEGDCLHGTKTLKDNSLLLQSSVG